VVDDAVLEREGDQAGPLLARPVDRPEAPFERCSSCTRGAAPAAIIGAGFFDLIHGNATPDRTGSSSTRCSGSAPRAAGDRCIPWGAVRRLLFSAFVKAHAALYRASGGRLGGRLRKGAPVLLLTTTGRKTGRRRTTPLLYVEEGDRYVVVASAGGLHRIPPGT